MLLVFLNMINYRCRSTKKSKIMKRNPSISFFDRGYVTGKKSSASFDVSARSSASSVLLGLFSLDHFVWGYSL